MTQFAHGELNWIAINWLQLLMVMEEWVEGTLRMTHQSHVLAYARITAHPGRPVVPQTASRQHRLIT
ncbi:MAG: hypothetical protein FJ244_09245 [Nitrospira sp.]|nr:hypothetical protein [Nitrospira sp.]